MSLLYLSLCVLSLLKIGLCYYDIEQFHDHRYFNATKSEPTQNCSLYYNQSVTFICLCHDINTCNVQWTKNISHTLKDQRKYYYTIDCVTPDTAGVIMCNNDLHDNYTWNVKVSKPIPPKFVTAPSNGSGCPLFDSQSITLGDSSKSPTCTPCVHCFVNGTPSPVVSWEYNGGSAGYVSILTNQSNQSSAFSTQKNGQTLCFGDIKQYKDFHRMYKCTAQNVGGTKFGCFTTSIVENTPYPAPGPLATHGPQYLDNRNVSLVMDTNYKSMWSTFRLCRYNRTSPEQLISCCDCLPQSACEWGTMDYSVDDHSHLICTANVSQTGYYQFQIYTSNYPCNLDIGDPKIVNEFSVDNSTTSMPVYHILTYSLGGVAATLLLGIAGTFYFTRRHYKRGRPGVRIIDRQDGEDRVDNNAPVSALVTPVTEYTEATNERAPLLPKDSKNVSGRLQAPSGDNIQNAERGVIDQHSMNKPRKKSGSQKSRGLLVNDDHKVSHSLDKETEKRARSTSELPRTFSKGGRRPSKGTEKDKTEYSLSKSEHSIHCFVDSNKYTEKSTELEGTVHVQATDDGDSPIIPTTVGRIAPNSLALLQFPPVQEQTVHKRTVHNKVKVYLIYSDDSTEWVNDTLTPILNEQNVIVLTKEDAVAGKTIAGARHDLVHNTDKAIVVVSSKLTKDKLSEDIKWLKYDLHQVTQKSPDPSEINLIPILYGNTKVEDLPEILCGLIPLQADDRNFQLKIKQSIFETK